MPISNRALRLAFLALALALPLLFAGLGSLKPGAQWRAIDVLGEGGSALIAASWLWIVLGSRPAGRVTLLLALGLGALALGAWADCLDELVSMKAAPWRADKWLESGLPPLGMLLLTLGLVGWRREQFQLSEHMQQRERLFREHRAFDRITELPQADYLRAQLALEQARAPGRPAALAMVEVQGVQAIAREHGARDGVRALQAVTHQLLLNLRNQDLLCRYAGDRFVILLPETAPAPAARTAEHLARMVRSMAFHTQSGERAALSLRAAAIAAAGEPTALLAALNRSLEAAAEAEAPTADAPTRTAPQGAR